MKLGKPMLEVFKLIIHEHSTIESLANALGKSENWVSEIITQLQQEGFVTKERTAGLGKSRIKLKIAPTPYALKLRDLMLQYKTIDFSEIIAGVKLDLLASICLDWKDFKTVSFQTGVSIRTARIYAKQLSNRGIIAKQKSMRKINDKAWPLLQEFLESFRNFSTLNGTVKWKYKQETIFQIDDEKLKKGVYTGLARYADWGVQVRTVKLLCYLPSRKLSKEEVFVHSLFEIEDSRTLYLALTFYLKNRLKKAKVEKEAMKYDLFTRFADFEQLLSPKEEELKLTSLPMFKRNEFMRVASMYGVKKCLARTS